MHIANQKAWKGKGMEGSVARWYNRTRRNDMEEFLSQARAVAGRLRSGVCVLEVAPGPGFFSIELAKLGNFNITGMDVSRTFVQIATENARNAKVHVSFRQGNASAMPFENGSFDFVYCSAAFKNFSQPVEALNEMFRVLRPAGQALIVDLRKDAPLNEITAYVKSSGRNWLDSWMTKWTFRHVLLKRAYTQNDFVDMAKQSCFGACDFKSSGIGFEAQFAKAA